MFRKALLATTALIVVVSLSSAVAGSGTRAQPTLSNIANTHDANEEFLRTYGGFLVSAYDSKNFSSVISRWTHVAVPITGHGETVSRIKVRERCNGSNIYSPFSVAIFSNTASGFPGKRIVGNTATASVSYKPITISIPPTKLKRHTTYWIGETVSANSMYSGDPHYWESSPKAKRKAYVQTHHFYSSSGGRFSSSTSPWTAQSTGPYLKLCSASRCR